MRRRVSRVLLQKLSPFQSVGSVKYAPEIQAFVWTIRSFPGGREYLMRAHFQLPSIISEEIDGKPPIQVKFEIPYYTTSGLQVGASFLFVFLFLKRKRRCSYLRIESSEWL